MSSKYASLPDIDTAPDVYETPDVPDVTGVIEADQSDEEQENEQIDRTDIQIKDAANRFKGKTEDDPKEALAQRKRALYRSYLRLNTAPGPDSIPSGEFEVLPHEPTLQETPVQKLRRLMFEVQELGEEMTGAVQNTEGDDENMQNSVILAQVNSLRYELDSISQQLTNANENKDEERGKDAALLKQTESSRRFLGRLKQIREANQSIATTKNDDVNAPLPHTENSDIPDVAHAAELEARLAALESLVGLRETANATTINPPTDVLDGITPTVARLEGQLQLLMQPRQTEISVRRAKHLTSELERLQRLKEKDAERVGVSSETEKKIDRLFATLDQLDPLIPLAPMLVERLHSLQQLHTRSLTFVDAVTATEQEQVRLEGLGKETEEQCAKLTTNLRENEEVIQRNVESLDKRINDLVERVSKLGVH